MGITRKLLFLSITTLTTLHVFGTSTHDGGLPSTKSSRLEYPIAPVPMIANHDNKPKQRQPTHKTRLTRAQRFAKHMKRYYTQATRYVWGTGTFKENRARRIGISGIAGTLIGLALYKKLFLGEYPYGITTPVDQLIYASHTGNITQVRELLKEIPTDPVTPGDPSSPVSQLLPQPLLQPISSSIKHDSVSASPVPALAAESVKPAQLDLNSTGSSRVAKLCGTNNALCAAVENNHIDIVRELLKSKANPDGSKQTGVPLHYARTPAIVTLLLDAKASINILDSDCSSALHFAASREESDSTACVRLLLAANTDIEGISRHGTPLYLASATGHPESVDLLLTAKANPNSGRLFKVTPLHSAMERNNQADRMRIVTSLLAHDADPRIRNTTLDKETPLEMADNPELKALLQEKANELNTRDIANAQLYNDSDSDKDDGENNGENEKEGDEKDNVESNSLTATLSPQDLNEQLYNASKTGDIENMTSLLNQKADPNAAKGDRNLSTPLQVAVHYKKAEAVQLLVKHKADVNQDEDIIFKAVRHPETLRVLLDNNANVDISRRSPDRYGHSTSVLQEAAQCLQPESVKLLLNHTQYDEHELSLALREACWQFEENPTTKQERSVQTVTLLLDAKADPYCGSNYFGYIYPYTAALENGSKELKQLLDNHGTKNAA